MQGGVAYVINDSKIVMSGALIRDNWAFEGAMLFAMSNSDEEALSFDGVIVRGNRAESSLMQLFRSSFKITGSNFIDNVAQTMNHGINMIATKGLFHDSNARFERVNIDNIFGSE